MKFIKRVILENFQSHKYSVVDFNEGLNVIVGPSDSGKSAIIRGIKWALYNEPSGDYFIREGETECSVTLEFNDNVTIKRYRSKYKNTYILTDREGNEIKFEGFGSNVPEEIIETVGIKKINLDSDSSNAINLGEQLEGAFLLSEKTSVRASAIGRLVGVNIIDDALRDVLRDNRNLNINKKNTDEIIQQLELEIKRYDYLDELKVKFKRLESLRLRLGELESKVEKLTKLNKTLYDIQMDKEIQSITLKKLGQIDSINEIINSLNSKTFKYKSLNNYNENLINIANRIEESNYILENLMDMDIVKNRILKLESLCKSKEKYENINNKYNKIRSEKTTSVQTIKELGDLEYVEIKLTDMDARFIRLRDLDSVKIKLENIRKSINVGKEYLYRFKDIDKCENNVTLLDEKSNMLTNYSNIYNKYLINDNEITKESNVLEDINKSIENHVTKYHDLLKKIEICPFCMSNIDDDKIEHIINHYIGG